MANLEPKATFANSPYDFNAFLVFNPNETLSVDLSTCENWTHFHQLAKENSFLYSKKTKTWRIKRRLRKEDTDFVFLRCSDLNIPVPKEILAVALLMGDCCD